MYKVLAKHLPDACPDKTDSSHIQISNFNQSLQTEFPRIHGIIELLSWNFAQILDKGDNRILV